MRGHNRKKESYLRNMILPTKGMRLEGSLERSTQAIKNQQIYARINLISRKKVSKSHFSAQNEVYIFNKQSFITNETSLKMEGEVSSKYHKLARSIMISCLHRKKNTLWSDNNSIYKAINRMFLRLVKQNVLFLILKKHGWKGITEKGFWVRKRT